MLAARPVTITSTWWRAVSMAEPAVGAPIDANGNLTADGPCTFEWDARNQLLAVTIGTHRSELSYDGLQRRVREVEKENGVAQSDTRVLWCRIQICEERGADGATVTRRTFQQGELVAGVAHFFAGDHLGTSRPLSPVLATLAVCGAGGAIAAGLLFGVQSSAAPIVTAAAAVVAAGLRISSGVVARAARGGRDR